MGDKLYRVFLVSTWNASPVMEARHLEKINLWLAKKRRGSVGPGSLFARSRLWRPYGDYSQFSLMEDGKGYDLTRRSVTRMQRYPADVSPIFLLTGEKPRPGENLRTAYPGC